MPFFETKKHNFPIITVTVRLFGFTVAVSSRRVTRVAGEETTREPGFTRRTGM